MTRQHTNPPSWHAVLTCPDVLARQIVYDTVTPYMPTHAALSSHTELGPHWPSSSSLPPQGAKLLECNAPIAAILGEDRSALVRQDRAVLACLEASVPLPVPALTPLSTGSP